MQIYFQEKTEEPHSPSLGCISPEFQINLTFIKRASNEKATRSFLWMSGIIFPASQRTHKTVVKIIGRRASKWEATHGGQRSVCTFINAAAWKCTVVPVIFVCVRGGGG